MRFWAALLGLLVAWLAFAGVAGADAPAKAGKQTAGQVLADDRFGFCNDDKYPLTEHEAQWCELLPKEDRRCPAFASACKAPRAVLEGALGPLARRIAQESEDAGDDGDKDEGKGLDEGKGEGDKPTIERGEAGYDRTPPQPKSEPIPTLGPIANILVWVIVGVMVVMLVLQLRGAGVGVDESPRTVSDEGGGEALPEAGDGGLPEPGETDVDRLLARAQRRVAQGELAGAVADGHAALVRRLAEHGRIRLHHSRTNGDHVRDLRSDPALYDPTRQVMRVVERVQFGHASVSRDDVEKLLHHVRAVVGTLAGVVFVLWTSLACTSDSGRDYSWSHSPSGSAGVIELLRGHEMEVEFRTSELESSWNAPVPVVLDGAALSSDEWTVLLNHVRGGGSAVLATQEPLPGELGIEPIRRAGAALKAADEVWGDDASRSLVVPPGPGLLTDDDSEDVWVDDDGIVYAAWRPLGSGMLLVLADDRLLTNGALAVADNGAVLVDLFGSLGDRFEFIDGGVRSMGGSGSEDPFEAMEKAHLTPVIIQLLVLITLLYLWRGVHFGKPRDPPPASRRRFGEHVEALAQHYMRAGARRHALRLYAGWALERVQERFGGRKRGLHYLARRIAARTGQDETEIMRTLVEAQHARDEDHDERGDDEDLRVIRELGRLIDTTRGR